jgi:hypothetical protein
VRWERAEQRNVERQPQFETLGIPVLRGRVFEEQDRSGAREVVVISETLARRYWPDNDPVGQIMNFSWGPGDEQEIIGVVGDVRHDGLDLGVEGMLYRADLAVRTSRPHARRAHGG